MGSFASVNGSVVPAEEARVSVLDNGFTFGDAVYETLRTYAGRPFELRRHLAKDVDGLGLEIVEMRERAGPGAHASTTAAGTSSSSSSRAMTAAADSAGSRPAVSSRSSGFAGSSYGSETPVKCSSSPDIAFL